MIRLALQVREFGHRGLHAVGQLVLRDARLNLGIVVAIEGE